MMERRKIWPRAYGCCLAWLLLCGCDGTLPGGGDEAYLKQVPERPHLVELDGEWLYVVDDESGLDVINVSNPASPTIIERVPGTAGEVVDMFRDRRRMYIAYTSSEDACPALADLDPAWTSDAWTELSIVASVPDAPLLGSRFCVPGSYHGGVKQGDFVYVLTRIDAGGLLLSIDVSDPFSPVLADVEHDERGSPGSRIRHERQALFVAVDVGAMALVRYIDISDDDGAIVPRDEVMVETSYSSPIFIDHHMDHLFVVVEQASGCRIQVLDVTDPDEIVPASVPFDFASPERLWDVRFEDDVIFVTTYTQHPGTYVDNLRIISREDPTFLHHLSVIQIPSWSQGFTIVGGQLIAIGRGEQATSVAVTVYKVVNLEGPRWVDTETFGDADGPTGWSLDVRGVGVMQRGELADPPLVVVPYTRFLWDGYECIPERHLQLLDVRWTALQVRGDWIPPDRHGRTEEVVQVGNKVFAISDVSIAAIGLMDRDAPREHMSLSLGGEPADGCRDVRPYLADEQDDVVSFFDVGCGVAGSGGASPPAVLALLLVALALLLSRRW
jgi:MYXO-CTERM domain-containing protein